MRGRRWWIGLIGVVVLVLVVRRFGAPHPISVESALVGTGVVEDVVANSEGGSVRSRAHARLGAERSGRVERIPLREGARVRAGAVVLMLESSTAATRLQASRRDFDALHAAHEAAHATELLARQNLSRSEPLRERGLISAEEIDAVRSQSEAVAAELRVAEARRAGAEAAVRLAQDEVAHLVVRAPFDGVLTRRYVEVGEPVVPGQTVLEIVDLDRLYVLAPIDERDAGRLSVGLTARITLDAFPGFDWPVVVTRVAPVVETVKEQNRTLEIELDLPTDPSRPAPRPGMTADVEVVLARREGVLRIPSFAVLEGGTVFLPEKGRVVSRRVDVGLRNWQWTEILAGLRPGDRVITSLDRPGLKPGAAITLAPSRAGEGLAADSASTTAFR